MIGFPFVMLFSLLLC